MFMIPKESKDYSECSEFVIKQIDSIIEKAIENGNNKIFSFIKKNIRRLVSFS